MTSDLLFGFALGLSSGIGIGSLLLAAYHDHVTHQIIEAEESWELDRESLNHATDGKRT